jgi:hypothetical protein
MARFLTVLNAFIRKRFVLLVFLGLALVSATWLQYDKIIYFHDENIPLSPFLALNDYLHVWSESTNFGLAGSGGIPKIIPVAVFAVLRASGLSTVNIEAVLYITLIFLAGYGSYLLFRCFRELSGNKPGFEAIVGGILYVLSPFTFIYVWRLNYIITRAWFFGFCPLLLWSFLKLITQSKTQKSWRVYGLVFVISGILITPGFSNPSFVVVLAILLGVTLAVALVAQPEAIKSKLLKAFGLFGVLLLLNLYWLLPRTVTFSSELQNAQNLGLQTIFSSNSSYLSIAKNFFLTEVPPLYDNPPWYSWSGYYIHSAVFIIAAMLLVLLAVVAITKKDKVTAIAFASYLAFAALMVGAAQPFGLGKTWLYIHVAALQAFRDPGKWGFGGIIFLAYLVGLGFVIAFEKTRQKEIRSVLVFLFLVSIFATSWPYFTGKLIPTKYYYPSAQIRIPADYTAVGNMLANTDHGRPILQFPVHGTHNAATWQSGGYKGVDILRNISGQPLLDQNAGDRYMEMVFSLNKSVVQSKFAANGVNSLMQGLGAKYIVVNKDSNPKFVPTSVTPKQYVNAFRTNAALQEVKDTQNLAVFQLTSDLSPMAYSPTRVNIEQPEAFSGASVTALGPWSVNAGGSKIASIANSNPLTIKAKFQHKDDSFYIRNQTSANIDPNTFPFIAIKASEMGGVNLAVSADDTQGNSNWLPEVTSQIKKFGGGANEPGVRYFSLLDFTAPIKTIRLNFIATNPGITTINLPHIVGLQGVFNDYQHYMSQDMTTLAYVNSKQEGTELAEKVQSGEVKVLGSGDSKIPLRLTGNGDVALVLRQAFDPNWKLVTRNTTISQAKPLSINGYQQGWIINLSEFCAKNPICARTTDGKYSLVLAATYAPQSTLVRGLGISVTALLAFILTLTAIRLRKPVARNKVNETSNIPEAQSSAVTSLPRPRHKRPVQLG